MLLALVHDGAPVPGRDVERVTYQPQQVAGLARVATLGGLATDESGLPANALLDFGYVSVNQGEPVLEAVISASGLPARGVRVRDHFVALRAASHSLCARAT